MRGDLTLVVDRRTSALRLDNGAVRIDFTDGTFRRVPLTLLERVVVHGAIPVGSDVWRALAARGIGAVLLPGRGRGDAAFVGAGLTAFTQWRIRQYAAFLDPEQHLEMARRILKMKLSAYECRAAQLPTSGEKVMAAQRRAREDAAHATSLEALRGIEGAAAAKWFAALRDCIPAEWEFQGRARRPPRDPVNALLSLAYTLALGDIRTEVAAQGLDPSLGFLHAPAPAREALALDALEPLRAGVDLFVLGMLPSLEITDFTRSETDGCRLLKTARGHFYAAWANACKTGFGGLFAESAMKRRNTDATNEPSDCSLATACLIATNRIRRALPDSQWRKRQWGE